MAGHARYSAMLDACVLYPAPVADALISLHVAGLYTARWTERIDREWIRGVLRARPDLEGKLDSRRDAMRQAVLDWEVSTSSYEPLMEGLSLPDKDDVHVLAAAIAGHVDCIVTSNLKDFPPEVLSVHGIEALHPDDFIVYQFDLEQFTAVEAFKTMRARLKKPMLTPEEFIQAMERNGLANTALRLRDAIGLI